MKDKRSRLRDARKLSSQPENADKKLWKTVFQDDTRLYYLPFGSTSVRPEQTLVGVVLLPKPRTRIDPCLIDEGRHERTSPSRRAQYAHYQHEYHGGSE